MRGAQLRKKRQFRYFTSGKYEPARTCIASGDHDPRLSCRHHGAAIATEPLLKRHIRARRGAALARQDRLMKSSPSLVALYLAIIVAGLLFALPNVLPASVRERWPSVLPDKPVALGLDLRGGSHLVREVDGTDLQREHLRTLGEEARRMLREADIPWRSVEAGERGVSISAATSSREASKRASARSCSCFCSCSCSTAAGAWPPTSRWR